MKNVKKIEKVNKFAFIWYDDDTAECVSSSSVPEVESEVPELSEIVELHIFSDENYRISCLSFLLSSGLLVDFTPRMFSFLDASSVAYNFAHSSYVTHCVVINHHVLYSKEVI